MTINKNFTNIIMIAHIGIEGVDITEEECITALPRDVKASKIFIKLDISKYKRDELYDAPFEQIAFEQQRKFKSLIEPVIKNNPNSVIAYFGFASIPAAFHLGFLLNGFNDFWIYQHHHDQKTWYQEVTTETVKDFRLLPIEMPTKVEKGKGDVFIRISTSYRVEPQHTYDVLNNPTNEFDICLQSPEPDAISSQFHIQQVIGAFQSVLSTCTNFLPDRDKIHLFMCTSAGIPFALGTKINPTIFPYVQTYQFSKDRSPKYKEAILITPLSDDISVLTASDIRIAKKLRKDWATQLKDKISPFIRNLPISDWFEQIKVDPITQKIPNEWSILPSIKDVSLLKDSIDLDKTTVENGFKYVNGTLSWELDDGFLVNVDKRFKNNIIVNTSQAGRLFLFHEGLHYSPKGHNLSGEIATGIGRFSKVIETADYQADVWAILNEYKFSSLFHADKVNNNLKKFFLDTIDTAVETMWSFSDNGKDLSEIPIRSMNRFLNWYWQWIRIEQLNGTGTFEEICNILFEQPSIEFAGAEIKTVSQRTYFKLSTKPADAFEIAIFYKNRVYRFAPVRILDIVDGFKQLNGNKIKQGLRSFYVSL